MSGNTIFPRRKLELPFTLEGDSLTHFHDIDYHRSNRDVLDFSQLEAESPLANASHLGNVTVEMNGVLDAAQPDSWSGDGKWTGGRIVVRFGLTLWKAPPDLPYGPDVQAFHNTLYERSAVDSDDWRVQARRNAYPDAQEL